MSLSKYLINEIKELLRSDIVLLVIAVSAGALLVLTLDEPPNPCYSFSIDLKELANFTAQTNVCIAHTTVTINDSNPEIYPITGWIIRIIIGFVLVFLTYIHRTHISYNHK